MTDANLLLFVQVMSYLHSFFPPHEDTNTQHPSWVPFNVWVTTDRDDFRTECLYSEAWKGVYKTLGALTDKSHVFPVVVIKGTRDFYEVLASKVRPLG